MEREHTVNVVYTTNIAGRDPRAAEQDERDAQYDEDAFLTIPIDLPAQNHSQVGSHSKRARLDNQLRQPANLQRDANMQNSEYNMMPMGETPLDPMQATKMPQIAESREAEQQKQRQNLAQEIEKSKYEVSPDQFVLDIRAEVSLTYSKRCRLHENDDLKEQ